jgi:hypothetical protein
MQKHQDFVSLEITYERVDKIVVDLRDKLLTEFWSHVPEGEQRDRIKARLENSIQSALESSSDNIEAT